MIPEKSVTDVEVDKWTSFMPVLLTALACSRGAVLELGIGHYSTPMLHEYCKATCRKLVSVEEDLHWYSAFIKKYDHHMFGGGNYNGFLRALTLEQWGVAFLDHSPGERRIDDMLLLLPGTDYIVIHDYTNEMMHQLSPHVCLGFNFHECATRFPATLVVSQKHDLSPFFHL